MICVIIFDIDPPSARMLLQCWLLLGHWHWSLLLNCRQDLNIQVVQVSLEGGVCVFVAATKTSRHAHILLV